MIVIAGLMLIILANEFLMIKVLEKLDKVEKGLKMNLPPTIEIDMGRKNNGHNRFI